MIRGLAIIFASCSALAVSAAQAQSVPPTVEPGRIPERFQPPPTPQSQPEIVVPAPSSKPPQLEGNVAMFTLTAVVIDGNTALPSSAFEPLYAPMLRHQVSLADVYRLRDQITAKYRAVGYILSQAIIPPQTIKNGVVRIQIVEGTINKVRIEGDDAANPLIRKMAQKIRESRPLNARDLERYTLLIGDLSGITVRTVLMPSDQPGSADLVIQVTHKPVSGFISADNRGSRAIGPLELSAGMSFNSLLGLNEQASVLVATASPTRELHYIDGRYVQPLGTEGLQLDLDGASSRSRPGGAIRALDALGTATILSAGLEEPLIRSRAKTLRMGLSFTYQNTRTDLLGVTFSNDRVRYLTGWLSYDVADAALGPSLPASTLFRVQLSQGLDILGARSTGSANLSRANGHSDFTLVTGEVSRVQRLGGPLSMALSASGQLAFVPLLSSQQFGLGGRRFGRGYEPSELIGDNGVAVSIEPRLDLAAMGPARGQLYAYYDAGRVWQKDPLPGQARSESLSSIGAGIRFGIGPHVQAAFELAKPLTRDIASRGNRNVRPLFDFTVSF